MRTFRNPNASTGGTDKPENPFSCYISWKAKGNENRPVGWEINDRGEKKSPKRPIDFFVLDVLFTIKGGSIEAENEVWSKPHYRSTGDKVTVWNKAAGRSNKVAEGPVVDIYGRLRKEYNANKCCQVFGFVLKTGQLAIIDLTGYAIGPFLDMEQDLAENPVITLEIEPQAVDMDDKKRKLYGQLYAPIFTTSAEFTPAAAEQAGKYIEDPVFSAYMNYLEGITEDANPEEKEDKNSGEPW